MSATTVSNVPAAPVKEKKPNLPAKFDKLMQFGYFFVSSVKDAGILDEPTSRELLERLCVFASVDDQKAFYEAWFEHAKDSKKSLRKTVADWRKANLPPKPKAPRAKKAVDPDAPKKERKPRAKKSKDNDLINELASLTASDPIPEPEPATLVSEVAVKKVRKPRAKKETVAAQPDLVSEPPVTAPVTETVSAPVTETKSKPKPKAKTVPKTVPLPVPAPVPAPTNDDDDDDDNLDVRDFLFNGTLYLIDDSSNNIFDHTSHEHLGHFNPTSKLVVLL